MTSKLQKITTNSDWAIGFIVLVIVGGFLCFHPRMKNLLFVEGRNNQVNSFIRQAQSGEHVSSREIWMFNDFFDYGYRMEAGRQLPDGLWSTVFPGLSLFTYDQVSVLSSERHASIDLVPNELGLTKQIALTFGFEEATRSSKLVKGTSDDFYIVTIYNADDAAKTNGYYFEDRSLAKKDWINISYYRL